MTLDEIRYLIQSFSEALRENAEFLVAMYGIEANLHTFPQIEYRVDFFMYVGTPIGTNERRKNMGSYPLDTYELKDFFNTAERVAGVFQKNEWLSNWRKSIEREWMLKDIGI